MTAAKAVNGVPALWTWIAPSEISVLPLPHSATTIPVRASCQRNRIHLEPLERRLRDLLDVLRATI